MSKRNFLKRLKPESVAPAAHMTWASHTLAGTVTKATATKPKTFAYMELEMPIEKRASAEFISTFWLVFGGCSSTVLVAALYLIAPGKADFSLTEGL